ARGDRIYHVPGQEHYEITRINESRGERWFCTEEEAIKAGWRKAKR
ncbi:MAG TPA: thermonuclease family protein, partial [bacterium]|nr:thermonuclease family protein [bacterium]